jgi:hypothetical protein
MEEKKIIKRLKIIRAKIVLTKILLKLVLLVNKIKFLKIHQLLFDLFFYIYFFNF